MTDELTPGEIKRALAMLQTQSVSKELYERDMAEIRADLHEIADSQKWLTRLLAGNFLAVVILLATQIPM